MAIPIPLGGQFYQSDSLTISDQECVNFYLNIPQATTITTESLFVCPGLVEATTAGNGVVNRGIETFLNKPYVINGSELYRIDESVDPSGAVSYSSVLVGSGIVGSGRVITAENGAAGDQLCIVVPESNDQFNAYIYTSSTNTLVQISDSDFNGPVSSVRYVDGYFEFTKKDDQQFFISALRDGLSYNALDNIEAEADTDNIVGQEILNNEPQIFGTGTFEPFQNIGGADFPFQRIQGGVQKVGLDSAFAITSLNLVSGQEAMVFLGSAAGETPSIWISTGAEPQLLSSTAINNEIGGYTLDTINNSFVFKYKQDGAQFVGFTFPGRRTFVYDFTAKEWHTRESIDDSLQQVPYRITGVVEAYGRLFAGDVLSNKIAILDREIYTEFGVPIRRRFVTPQFDNDGNPFFLDSLELVGDTGIGNNNGQGSDPLVLMSYSTDGARTYGTRIPRSVGKIGETRHRTIWNSLGRVARQVCWKFEFTDPVKWVISKVEVNFS